MRGRRHWRSLGMVGVAQLVERRLVVADVAGSSPVTHPHVRGPVLPMGAPARVRSLTWRPTTRGCPT